MVNITKNLRFLLRELGYEEVSNRAWREGGTVRTGTAPIAMRSTLSLPVATSLPCTRQSGTNFGTIIRGRARRQRHVVGHFPHNYHETLAIPLLHFYRIDSSYLGQIIFLCSAYGETGDGRVLCRKRALRRGTDSWLTRLLVRH